MIVFSIKFYISLSTLYPQPQNFIWGQKYRNLVITKNMRQLNEKRHKTQKRRKPNSTDVRTKLTGHKNLNDQNS